MVEHPKFKSTEPGYTSRYITLQSSKEHHTIPRYYTFTAARCVIGFAIAGIESACFVLVMELVGPSKRTLAGIVCWDAATCGILAFGLKSATADLVEYLWYWLPRW